MKRLLTTLIILLVVVVAGLTALVILINPNDFRHYIVKQVQKKSGYQLVLQDDLRWHVWPKLSILTGQVSLTAPGAQQPAIVAENMRLDVELLPLLSHQLAVKEVMFKGAVFHLTPDSQPQQKPEAPIAPEGDIHYPAEGSAHSWKLDIDRIKVEDSLLIWQINAHSQLNIRDINLLMKRQDKNHLNLELNSKINKNQQEFAFEFDADINIADYPQHVTGDINSFKYQFTGVGVPPEGITGEGAANLQYDAFSSSVSLQKIALKMNESELTGGVDINLKDKPAYSISLFSSQLNLDNLLGWDKLSKNSFQEKLDYRIENNSVKPVIAKSVSPLSNYDLSFLKEFDAHLLLKAKKFIYQGMDIDNFVLKAVNNEGVADILRLSGNVFGGYFALPTTIDATVNPTKLHTKPLLQNIELQPLLQVLDLPSVFSGQLALDGDLWGDGYDEYAVAHYWQGDLNVNLKNARMDGLNIPMLIQQSFSRVTDQVKPPTNTQSFTGVQNLSVKAKLAQGEIKINRLSATSDTAKIEGQGKANLLKQNIDVALLVQLTGGWEQKNELVSHLEKLKVPLRVYGNWNNLQYALNVESILHDELQQKIKQSIKNWLDNNDSSKNKKKTAE
ncbi:outer membrane assembly protein AsmA [Xenorhabdus innexi]|uniref:Outer membrane assembly protein AsmA n=1 Tax=Xenorhabdus innexi TaxID=290109 RepID=A0A1N6MZW3_9GAMM|nr:outer membrane assembly protein AsmA [Xenorhabdus innexi]PHM37846.1 outer membrane assembly protein AsmA [Xenorhabdus innexi]SIP74324.1 Suppressor of ompF assembly mutants [Xenorhabdus innexi]